MAALLGVSRGVLARWERGDGQLDLDQQNKLRDVCWQPPAAVMETLKPAIEQCSAPRALCRTPRLKLLTLSEPARRKRPSIVDWIGRDLHRIASGVLQEILDDNPLQKAIAKREVVSIVSTTASVLATPESATIGAYRTTTNFFFHDGALFNDSISVPVSPNEWCGYTPIYMDEMGQDLFGDRDAIEAAMQN